MGDIIDDANDLADKYLQINLSHAIASKVTHRDAEATICGGCQYAAITYGLKCSDWQSCLSDHRKMGLL